MSCKVLLHVVVWFLTDLLLLLLDGPVPPGPCPVDTPQLCCKWQVAAAGAGPAGADHLAARTGHAPAESAQYKFRITCRTPEIVPPPPGLF